MAPYAGEMRSMIIEMLSSRGVDELLDPEGRKELKEEIKKKLNSQILAKIPEFIPDPEKEDQKIFEIAEVEFSEFVIQ
jgi:flagellar basal body-associated protein FliL